MYYVKSQPNVALGKAQFCGQNGFMVGCMQSIICTKIKEHFGGKVSGRDSS